MIDTEHNGHQISYNDDDEWSCRALDLKAKTLSALKAKINDFDAKERKLGDKGVALLHVDSYRRFGSRNMLASRVRATMLDKDYKEGDTHAVLWISHEDKQREKVGIHTLIHDTEENLKILSDAALLRQDAATMVKKADEMVAAIPRMTVETLKSMALETKVS